MLIVSYIILLILVIIYFTSLNMYNTSNELVNYLLRSFYHANVEHLVANGISFYGLSFMENVLGSKTYLMAIIFIWIVSSLLLYIYHSIFPSRKVLTIGFSAIVFGLIVVYYSLMRVSTAVTLAGLFVSIVPQLFIRGISYEGHICGIVAGFLYITLFPVNKKI